MLYLVTGPVGSGKTERLYDELEQAYRAGIPCVWIAPEQQSVQAEREILSRLGDGCNLSVEILNFERLPERVARAYGYLAGVKGGMRLIKGLCHIKLIQVTVHRLFPDKASIRRFRCPP